MTVYFSSSVAWDYSQLARGIKDRQAKAIEYLSLALFVAKGERRGIEPYIERVQHYVLHTQSHPLNLSMLSVFKPVQMSAYVGHIIPKGDPEDFYRLTGTLAINQGDIEMHGTWIANNEAHLFQGLSQPSFCLTHTSSTAYEDESAMNGWFLFNGSFEYNESRVMEDGVIVHLSLLDNGILSVSGRGMNEIGVFTFIGEGEKSDADGPVYKVMLRKKYIYEAGTKLWKWHSVDEEGQRALCVGEVTKFDVKKSRIDVHFYQDGKSEWISEDMAIEIEQTAVPPKENLQPIEVGTPIAKYFMLQNSKTRKYTGRVISCHPKKNLLTIEYDDGTKEELEEDVVRHVQIVDNPERLAAQAWFSKPSPPVAEQVVSSTRATTNAPKMIAKTSPEVIDLATSSDEDEDEDAFNDADMGRHNKKQRTASHVNSIDYQLKVAKCAWNQAKAKCELSVAKASSELNVAKAQSTVTMATLELKIALLEKSKQDQEQAMSGEFVTTEPNIAKVEELMGRKAPPTSLSHAPKENSNCVISPLL